MKIFQKRDIEDSFSQALDAIQIHDISAEDLGIYFGSLSVSIAARIQQLKSGVAKSSNREREISKLQKAEGCLQAKINKATVSEMSQEIMAAYKIYGASN